MISRKITYFCRLHPRGRKRRRGEVQWAQRPRWHVHGRRPRLASRSLSSPTSDI